MKTFFTTLIVFAVIFTSGPTLTAYAATAVADINADINADIKAEFENDVPTSYSGAIKQTISATPSTPRATQTAFDFTESDNEQVRVVYNGYAKFLGFIPVPVSIEVAIDAEGDVRVALPWYRFLLSYEDTASVENSLSARVQAKTNLPKPSGVLSETDQAVIMTALQEELSFHFTR